MLTRLTVLLCALSAGAVPACTARAAPDTTLSSCYSGADATSTAVLYAADNGFFPRNGLKVNMIFTSGGAAAVAALLSGQTPICQMSGANVVSAAQAGEDLVVVAGIVNTTPFKLVAASTVTKPEQLIGQTVSSPFGGGSYELGLRLHLASIGVGFDQVKYAPLGSQSAVVAAMQAGVVAAALQVAPDTTALLSQGFVEIPFGANAPPAFQHIALVTRRSYVTAHRAVVLAYVRAVAEAIAAMKRDEDGAIQVIARYRKLDPVADREALATAYRDIVQNRFASVPEPTVDGMQYIINLLPPAPGARTVTAEDLVDRSIVAELRRSGLVDNRQP
jgi:ABC-type nitrate/sulfonate/bicarbonate transport system substrate-binding protein